MQSTSLMFIVTMIILVCAGASSSHNIRHHSRRESDRIRWCGWQLTKNLAKLCNGCVQPPGNDVLLVPKDRRRSIQEVEDDEDFQQTITKMCCTKPCERSYLLKYCCPPPEKSG